MIDAIVLDKLKQCGGRIDRFQHVHGEAVFIQFQRLGPMPQPDQPIDFLVVALLVESGIQADAALLEDIEAGKPRRRYRGQNAFGGDAQRFGKRG